MRCVEDVFERVGRLPKRHRGVHRGDPAGSEIETLRQWAATNCRTAAVAETAEAAAASDGIASRRARMVDL